MDCHAYISVAAPASADLAKPAQSAEHENIKMPNEPKRPKKDVASVLRSLSFFRCVCRRDQAKPLKRNHPRNTKTDSAKQTEPNIGKLRGEWTRYAEAAAAETKGANPERKSGLLQCFFMSAIHAGRSHHHHHHATTARGVLT